MTMNTELAMQFVSYTDEAFVNHLYLEHHLKERELLDELDSLVNRVLLAHYAHDKDTVLMLHRNVSTLRMLLQSHFAIEEKELFRAIRQADKTEEDREAIRSNLLERIEEHQEIWAIIQDTKEKTQSFTPPDYACPTMQSVYTKLQQLAEDLEIHFEAEGKILRSRYI